MPSQLLYDVNLSPDDLLVCTGRAVAAEFRPKCVSLLVPGFTPQSGQAAHVYTLCDYAASCTTPQSGPGYKQWGG
jgi:hypothetical protein